MQVHISLRCLQQRQIFHKSLALPAFSVCFGQCMPHPRLSLAGWMRMQVQRIAARGSLPTRAVHIPGAIVDKVAVLTTCACFQPHVDVLMLRG